MKNKLFLIAAIVCVHSLSYSYPIVSDTAHLVGYEKQAYENLLKTVDEYNRQHGIESNYFDSTKHDLSRTTDKINIVAIEHAADSGLLWSKRGVNPSKGFHGIHDIIENGAGGLREDGTLDKLSHVRYGESKRFYFGNGNVVKDIQFINKDSFDKKVEEVKEANNDKYHLKGSYSRFNSDKMNQLDISMDDYNSKIKDKSKSEVLAYLKDKLADNDVNTEIKNGELWTKDSEGKEWKVLWELDPVSIKQFSWSPLTDTIFSKIYLYDEFDSGSETRGETLYTKDSDIYMEDKHTYKDKINLAFNSYDDTGKPLEEIIEKASNGKYESEIIEKYYADKKQLSDKKMTQEDFNKKWIEPFEKGEDGKTPYQVAWESYQGKINEIDKDPQYDGWENRDKKQKAKEEAMKNYGFYSKGNADESKYADIAIRDTDIYNSLLGKNIDFRGKGRIEGKVDFGEGYNVLTVKEQLTGEFGTDIVLGANSSLHNLDVIYVGGTATGSKNALSGQTSLSIDIDKNIKNDKGHLVQHVFKDSDEDIVFSADVNHVDNRNDFTIQLMASRLDEDSIIDMGRDLKYKAENIYDDTGDENLEMVDMKITLDSDSIAHDLTELEEKTEEGNSLVQVTVKDEIKFLSDTENEVYKSLKNSSHLGSLFETLTTTNKKTIFDSVDIEKENNKNINLAKYIRTKTSDELLKDLAQVNFTDEESSQLKDKIDSLKEREEVTDSISKLEKLNNMKISEEYKELNLNNSLSQLKSHNLRDLWDDVDAIDSTVDSNESLINEKFNSIKGIASIFNKDSLKQLSETYGDGWGNDVIKEISELYYKNDNFEYYIEQFENADNLTDKKNSLKEFIKISIDILHGTQDLIDLNENSIDTDLFNELNKLVNAFDGTKDFKELYDALYYQMREEEALKELKTLISQLKDKNIYSKLNKISKNEMGVYSAIPFNIARNLNKNEEYVNGAFVSNRVSESGFKGNIYTGYAVYEKPLKENTRLGFMFGGGTSNHNEIKNDTLKSVTTDSTIKGTSVYLGSYLNHSLNSKVNLISGAGFQHGQYKVDRQFKNNYQDLTFKGKTNTNSLNLYSGAIYTYALPNDLKLEVKGLLSYSLIAQDKINESKHESGLSLDIDKQNYNYLDGEFGVNLSKTLYGKNIESKLSGGIYAIAGLYGYDNEDLKGRIHNSSSSFNIKGQSLDKNSTKLFLDYNVIMDSGMNYGLEGTYITNSQEDNIGIGVKAGYTF